MRKIFLRKSKIVVDRIYDNLYKYNINLPKKKFQFYDKKSYQPIKEKTPKRLEANLEVTKKL